MGAVERGTYPLRGGEEGAIRINFLNYQKHRAGGQNIRKWLMIKEEKVLRKLLGAPEPPIWEV
jgi:hypothetical protein